MLIINHFIIQFKLHGMVTGTVAVELRNISQRHCSFIHIWIENANLNNLFYMNVKFDELLSEIGIFFLQKSA